MNAVVAIASAARLVAIARPTSLIARALYLHWGVFLVDGFFLRLAIRPFVKLCA
jgi:hypothetical protein